MISTLVYVQLVTRFESHIDKRYNKEKTNSDIVICLV